MDSFFTGLNKRQTMLLLTAVTFGGQEGVESFALLPEDEGDLLRERARQILAIPREKRIPFLVSEMKRMLTRRADELRAADPEVVAKAIAQERPAMKELILRALPSQLASKVRARLKLGEVSRARDVRPDLLAVVRWRLEERLAEQSPRRPAFRLTDLLVMSGRDLLFVCDALGGKALAPLAGALPSEEREAWLAKLSIDQRNVAGRIARDHPEVSLAAAAARRALQDAEGRVEPRHAVRRAGVRIVARACLAQSTEFAARVIEEHHDDFGRLLAPIVSEERQPGRRRDGAAADKVLSELETLSEKGVVERPMALPPPPVDEPARPGYNATGPVLRPGARPVHGSESRRAINPLVGPRRRTKR